MKATLSLKWESLSKYNSNSPKKNSSSGVYVWGFRINGEFTPYYVGIARDVHYRIAEHITSLISGKYTVYHKDHLDQFAKYKDDKSGNYILFIPDWPENLHDFLERRSQLSKHIDFMVDNFEFTYAVYDEKEASLKELEKYMIALIGKESLANTRGGHSIIELIKHGGSEEVVNLFKTEK